LTNVATRPLMLENLSAMLSAAPYMFLSPRLLEECRTFVRHVDGSCSAASGTHDDTVMAIAQRVRTELHLKETTSAEEARFRAMHCA
jgi:hypothetical protein